MKEGAERTAKSEFFWLSVLVIGVLIRTFTPIFFKLGSRSSVTLSSQGTWQMLETLLTNPYYWLGLLCLGLFAVIWPIILTHFDLAVAYPVTNLRFAFIAIFGAVYFGEDLGITKVLAVILITSGFLLIRPEGKIEEGDST